MIFGCRSFHRIWPDLHRLEFLVAIRSPWRGLRYFLPDQFNLLRLGLRCGVELAGRDGCSYSGPRCPDGELFITCHCCCSPCCRVGSPDGKLLVVVQSVGYRDRAGDSSPDRLAAGGLGTARSGAGFPQTRHLVSKSLLNLNSSFYLGTRPVGRCKKNKKK